MTVSRLPMAPVRPPLDLPPGGRVAWLRLHYGLKQRELAAAVGVSENAVARLEGVKTMPRKLDTISAIAAYFRVPLEALIAPPTRANQEIIPLRRRSS